MVSVGGGRPAHTGLQSLHVLVSPHSIPGTVKRNALVYSANRASAIRIVVQWQISTVYSCLLGHGGVWELRLMINYQRKYPGWGSLTQLLMTLSNTWQNGNFLVIARVSYFLILWFHEHLKLCWERHSDCKEPRYLSCCACLFSSRSGRCVPGYTLELQDSFWLTRHKETTQTKEKHQQLHKSDLPSRF